MIDCSDLGGMPGVIKLLLNIIQWGVPVAIILFGSIDLFKAVIASKEDEIKNAQKLLIKRIIYGAVIFFLAVIVKLVFKSIGGDDANHFVSCIGL